MMMECQLFKAVIGFVVVFDFKCTFTFLVVKVEGCRLCFCSAEL